MDQNLKIVHLADIHVSNNIDKLSEQEIQFESLYPKLKISNADIIILAGDTLDKHLMINEAKVVASKFLKELSKYCKQVIVTLGNHEVNRNNLKRTSSIESLIKIIRDPKIKFLKTTGFFQDEIYNDLIYCNWNFGDYKNPYIENKDEYDSLIKEGKFIIDLFHDPIYNSKNSEGKIFNDSTYLKVNDFKGDLLLLGDIHQRQFFNGENGKIKGAYPSSLFQLNHGESQDKHGLILWDINTKTKEFTYEEIDIITDYSFINININNGFDYDNINIVIQKPTTKMRIKIIWNDFRANINKVNERLISDYINNTYGSENIISIKFERKQINENSSSNATDNELENINDKSVQTSILVDYLKNTLKYDDEFIKDILIMDNHINNKLTQTDYVEKYDWKIDSFYLDNFRSHGERFEINWKDQDGIWKLNGLNEHGKTNFWSAICYLLYGKTIETLKKEKYGDNRFINNKRDLDYCEVGGIIDINNDKFEIKRRTERKWNRNHTELTACPTIFSINKLNNDGTLSNENEHEKSLTNKKFEDIIGDLDDFLRLSVITADTLNNILSLDESVFIDSILRDAGLDVYEKKLAIYKEIKKQTYKKEEKIILDINKSNLEIDNLYLEIINIENDIVNIEKEIKTIENRIKKGVLVKEDEIKKLHKIDNSLTKLNIENIKNEVNKLVIEKSTKEDEINVLDDKIILLKSTYDIEKYQSLLDDKVEFNKWLIESNKNNQNKQNEIQIILNKISLINGEILLLNKEITSLEKQIELEKEFIDKEIKNINIEIKTYENSKTCPSCNRELDKNTIKPIEEKINGLKNKIKELESGSTIKDIVDNINNKIINIKNEIIKKDNDKVTYESDINKIKIDIKFNNELITNKTLEMDLVSDEIRNIDNEIKEIELRNKLEAQKNNIPNLIELINLKISNNKRLIDDFNSNLLKINDNLKIEDKINCFEKLLTELTLELNKNNNYLNTLKNIDLLSRVNKISQIKENILKFIEQERKELLNKTYSDCLSRDGIPRLLLLKMRERINDELNILLSNVAFNVYFDEDLSLKMYDKIKPNAIINAIEGCGKQRTFISLVLRLALRGINNKSKNNMLLLDEVCDRLVDTSVQEFFDLLEIIKNRIDKIIIVEHAYGEEFVPDYNLSVIKDVNGISKMIL